MTNYQSQREILKTQRESQKKKQMATVAIIAVVAIAALVLLYFLPRLKRVNGPAMGDPEAPVKVEQFSNFTCSHCRTFALESEAAFKETYVDTGKVYLTYYNYQFQDDESANAAKATYCAGDQGKFFEFKHQVYLNSQYAGAFAEASLDTYAQNVGLNMAEFQECVASNKHAATVNDARNYAQMQRVEYTPTFSVNGKLVFSNELNDAVEAALAELNN